MGCRNPEKEAFWRLVMTEWSCSGKRVVAYCQERGLNEAQFGYWKGRIAELDRIKTPLSANASPFVGIQVSQKGDPMLQPGAPIQIRLPNQIVLSIPRGATEPDVMMVMRVLRGVA